MEIHVTVNGTPASVAVEAHWTLLQLLRDRLELKGAKEGCGVGVCGTCTVLLDGRPVSSCLTLVSNADGCDVLTIEGLGEGSALDPIQQGFLESTAFQCAFCTSGMIMATKALLAMNPDPSEEDVKDYLSGNLCRCGTYIEVLQAVKRARELVKSRS